jgi:phytoene desaturase
MIPFLERAQGVFYTPGGMYSVVESMRKLFEEKGGIVRTGEAAQQIVVEEGRARGVITDQSQYPADLVVSNADLAHTYADLIEVGSRKKYTDARLRRLRHTMGCFLMFLGVKGRLPKLAHHTLILSHRYRGLLDDIFRHRPLPTDFSLYLHAPTQTEAAMAPPGCESLMVLSPVSNLENGHDWDAPGVKQAYADRILDSLEKFGLKDLRKNLEVCRLYAPTDFRKDLSAVRGNAFGLEPTLTQTGYFRPHNRSEDVHGLYFAGAGTHPGAGVPGVLLSAETVENCILEDLPSLRQNAHTLA